MDSTVTRSVSVAAEQATTQVRDASGVPLWRIGTDGWREK
jgi:hypothetical protein